MALSADTWAARITNVADAADTIMIGEEEVDDPFDVFFSMDWVLAFQTGKLTRETPDSAVIQGRCTALETAECDDVNELKWGRKTHRVTLNLEVGIFHDLAITVGLPIYVIDKIEFDYDDSGKVPVSASNSTIDGDNGPTLFAHDAASQTKGVGDLQLGVRWGPLSQERDDSKPNWVIYFKWQMPFTAKVHDPAVDTASASSPGSVGDGIHRLTFGTALSRRGANFGLIGIDPNVNRRGYTEPYIELGYTLPVVHNKAPGAFQKNNEGFGGAPSHVGRLNAGFEVIPYEDIKNKRWVSIDIGFRGLFCSEGRMSYNGNEDCSNELGNILGDVLYTEQYFRLGGYVGMSAQPLEFFNIYIGFGISYKTEHYLTFENRGEDTNGNGSIDATEPQNPFFCGQDPNGDLCSQPGVEIDLKGFRLKSEQAITYELITGLQMTF